MRLAVCCDGHCWLLLTHCCESQCVMRRSAVCTAPTLESSSVEYVWPQLSCAVRPYSESV